MIELFEADFGDVVGLYRTREGAENAVILGVSPRSVTAVMVDPTDPIGGLKVAMAND